jgi:hypothetical protein
LNAKNIGERPFKIVRTIVFLLLLAKPPFAENLLTGMVAQSLEFINENH